jgi:hypothetical protein
LSEVILWDAILAADSGHPDAAFHSVLDSFGLARSLDDHPYPVAQMLREACLADSTFGLEQIITRTALTEDQLRDLEMALRRVQGVDWIKRSMMEERGSLFEVHELLPKPPVWYLFCTHGEDRAYTFWCFLLYPQRGMLESLDVMDRYLATASLPVPRRVAPQIQIASEVQPNRYFFSKWWPPPPNWARFTSGFVESQARLATAETALAIERHRLAHQGRIPDELKELVPAFLASLPTGPADGKPIRFKQLAKGYVVSTSVLRVDYNGTKLKEVNFKVER